MFKNDFSLWYKNVMQLRKQQCGTHQHSYLGNMLTDSVEQPDDI